MSTIAYCSTQSAPSNAHFGTQLARQSYQPASSSQPVSFGASPSPTPVRFGFDPAGGGITAGLLSCLACCACCIGIFAVPYFLIKKGGKGLGGLKDKIGSMVSALTSKVKAT